MLLQPICCQSCLNCFPPPKGSPTANEREKKGRDVSLASLLLAVPLGLVFPPGHQPK